MNGPGFVLALDVGGTKLAAARVAEDGTVDGHAAVPTEAADPEALWALVDGLVARVLDGATPVGVGVACGGPMRWPAGVVSPLNIPAWRDFPLRARLAERVPGCPVRVHNDAVCVAVGEHWRGAGRAAHHLLGMVVSTGVGGGLVLGGRVVDGSTGNAGHIGHVVVHPGGPTCECGGVGCLEAVARGPAVVAWALDRGWRPAREEPTDGRSLAAAARRGDRVALAAFERAGAAVGIALASAASLLELDTVCVGGGLAQAGPLLLDAVRRSFRRHARLPFAAGCAVEPAALGVVAGLVGAAALVWQADRYWNGGD